MPTHVITDSTSSLDVESWDRAADGPLEVIPLHVVIDGKERAEGIDITSDEVVSALRDGAGVSTSRPSPAVFLEAYERAAEAGASEVVSVHISADLSGTVEAAMLAAQQSPIPVYVVDSRVVGMALGYAAIAGARAAADGASGVQVEEAVKARAEAARTTFYVDTLEHLVRGGRIGKASAMLGTALAIKPLLSLDDGLIDTLEKVRTRGRALARLEDLAVTNAVEVDRGHGVDIAVHHLDAREAAEEISEHLRERLEQSRDVRVVEVSSVIGAHVGPGLLGVVVSPRLS